MSRYFLWLVVFAAAGCASSGPSLDPATIDDLDYRIPSGWSSRDLSRWERTAVEWRPDADDNDHKESLVVVRADRPATAKSNPAQLRNLLANAQQNLAGAMFGPSINFTTRNGFAGARIEGQLTDHGRTYRRIHAVLVDGSSLLHILYTGRELDRDRFEAVVDGVAKKGT